MPLPLKGRAGKLVYAVGNIGITGFSQLMGASLVFFLTTVVGLSAWLAGLIWISYGVWNAIDFLIIGGLSDRTRTRWGRRRPYILMGIPILLLFSILVWSPPLGGKPLTNPYSLLIFFDVLVVIAFYVLGYVMADLPTDALFPEMYVTEKERSEVTIYRECFSVVGAIIAMVVFPLVIEHFSNQFGTFGAWTWAGAIISAVFVGAFLFSFLGMRERKEFSMVDKHLPLIASFKAALTNKAWIAYVGANLMTSCMTDWISAMAFFFVTISLGMQLGAISIMMGLEMVGTFAFFPIWRKIYLLYGTKVTLAASTITFNIVPMLGLVVHDVLGISIMGFIAGSTIGGLVLARSIMWTDVVDEDEIKTGVRREGMYSGVAAPINQIDPIVVGVGSAFLLTSIGFVSGVAAKAQRASVGPGIRLGMAIFTLVFTGLMLIFLAYYPLGKKKVDEVKKEIEKMHMEKAKKLEDARAQGLIGNP